MVESGAIQALKVRSGRRARPEDVSTEGFEQLRRELLEKEKALVELSVEYALLKKGLRSGCTIDGQQSTSLSRRGR